VPTAANAPLRAIATWNGSRTAGTSRSPLKIDVRDGAMSIVNGAIWPVTELA
jgi:hypothetical protein